MKFDREKVNQEYNDLLKEGRLMISSKYWRMMKWWRLFPTTRSGFASIIFDETISATTILTIFRLHREKCSNTWRRVFRWFARYSWVQIVNEFQCGVLVENLGEQEIRAAILKIRENYDLYVNNALKAARYYDFDSAIAPYLDLIEK